MTEKPYIGMLGYTDDAVARDTRGAASLGTPLL
jgi:hypothetical protein